MAGVKGRSGGPRKNAGGKRPGAGRKPKASMVKPKARAVRQEPTVAEEAAIGAGLPPGPNYVAPAPAPAPPAAPSDAKLFLEGVLTGSVFATPDQIRAAQALLPFQHKKLGETGKKEQRKEDAGKVSGRYAPAAPPRLATVAGKPV